VLRSPAPPLAPSLQLSPAPSPVHHTRNIFSIHVPPREHLNLHASVNTYSTVPLLRTCGAQGSQLARGYDRGVSCSPQQ
jgi:hypothetical protein